MIYHICTVDVHVCLFSRSKKKRVDKRPPPPPAGSATVTPGAAAPSRQRVPMDGPVMLASQTRAVAQRKALPAGEEKAVEDERSLDGDSWGNNSIPDDEVYDVDVEEGRDRSVSPYDSRIQKVCVSHSSHTALFVVEVLPMLPRYPCFVTLVIFSYDTTRRPLVPYCKC